MAAGHSLKASVTRLSEAKAKTIFVFLRRICSSLAVYVSKFCTCCLGQVALNFVKLCYVTFTQLRQHLNGRSHCLIAFGNFMQYLQLSLVIKTGV